MFSAPAMSSRFRSNSTSNGWYLFQPIKPSDPVNVYGATKRLAEMIVLDAAHRTKRAFSVVRFGNVLGSRGSVIPLFKRQIANGGPVLITHPDMERYFMTIPEAVHLVLQAASMGSGGEAFLLDMGQQIRILDLAEDLIRLSGLEPGRDIEIEFTGIRPGEKLSEELWEKGKSYEKTAHPDIVRSEHEDAPAPQELQEILARLESLILGGRARGDHYPARRDHPRRGDQRDAYTRHYFHCLNVCPLRI